MENSKDIYDFIVNPTKEEIRENSVIDKIKGLYVLNIPNNIIGFQSPHVYLISDAILNYNNEIFMARTFYAYATKYNEYYKKVKDGNYEIWTKKYIEQTIKELFSIYDKSINVINYLFNINIKSGSGNNGKVANELKCKDKDFYDKMSKIYKRLHLKGYDSIRNNITHNDSDMFFRFSPNFNKKKIYEGWETKKGMTAEEGFKAIDEICNLLKENEELINNKIIEIYPLKIEQK